MIKKTFAEMTTAELKKRVSFLKIAIYLSLFAGMVMLGVGVYLILYKQKFTALTILPLPMGLLVMANVMNLKRINRELKHRGI